MQLFEVQRFTDLTDLRSERQRSWQNPVIAFGNFDGVHLGHQQIIGETVKTAKILQGTSICLTFRPHPARILHPESAPKLLQTFAQKQESIAAQGIDVLLAQQFDADFSHVTYQEFFERYLHQALAPKALRVGCRFAFGYQRRGNAEKLAELCMQAGIDFQSLAEFRLHGEAISSSRIRELLGKGEVERANQLLGRPYTLVGKVEKGAGRGAPLGFPTANIAFENDPILPRGVYVCEARLSDRKNWCGGVANLGVRPTFADAQGHAVAKEVLEVHLFDLEGDLYGMQVSLAMLGYLRPEKRFSEPGALCAQILKDVAEARKILEKSTP